MIGTNRTHGIPGFHGMLVLRLLCALAALGALGGALGVAGADPNELGGGVFATHYVAALAYSVDPPAEGWCGAYDPHGIGSLGEVVPAIYGQDVPAVWYVIAAWDGGEKDWCGVEFGFGNYDASGFDFTSWGPCFPTTGLEIPASAWPGPLQGTAFVTSGESWSGNWKPVYYFTGYAGAYGVQTAIPLATDPLTGFSGVTNCLNPPGTFPFEATQRGALGINSPGTVPSFPPPLEAVCCRPSGLCEILPESDCLAVGGEWLWWIESCTPNPCPGEEHVCCLDDGGCALLDHEENCLSLSGTWHPEWSSCDPNPCPQPSVCCVAGTCVIVHSAQACDDLGGMHHPEWDRCVPNPCPAVCCFDDGSCQIANQGNCLSQGGSWRPDLGESCEPNPCELPPGPHNLEGGALYVHHVPALVYSVDPPAGGWCDAYNTYAIQGTDELITRIDVQTREAATWYVLAAWEGFDKIWCGVEFGLGDYDASLFSYAESSPCFPSLGLEIHTPGWPGPGTGTAIVTTTASWQGNWLPVYFFGGYAYGYTSPGQIPVNVDPTTGIAGFSNCASPPRQFEVDPDHRGALGINTDGYPPTGPSAQKVCCLPTGECRITGIHECDVLGGEWHGEWDNCDPNPCPRPAVCCVHGNCLVVYSQSECDQHSGGVYHPEWTSCNPNPCPPEPYVCCFSDGSCQVLMQTACLEAGGTWRPGLGQSCTPNPCPQPHVCCVYSSCILVMTASECLSHPGGVYHPEWLSCDPNPCPQYAYVCCLDGGACLVLTEPECVQAGGTWHPAWGQSCSPNPCPQEPRVCCLEGNYCELLTQQACAQAGGQWRPDLGESCTPNPCEGPTGPHNLADGALFVHHVPQLPYSTDPPSGGWCEALAAYPVHSVGDLITRIDVQSSAAATWFVIAAWEGEDRTWCGVEFGFGQFDAGLFGFSEVSPCYPVTGLELPTGEWPGPGQGTAIVTTGVPWEGNWQPVYFFGGYAYGYVSPGQIPLAVDPTTGFIGFSNCLTPPWMFAVDPARRGVLGINTDGYPPSGPSNEKVCCLPSRECLLAGLYECSLLGGIWHPEWDSCDPNPCPAEAYVCCFDDGSCQVLPEAECDQAGAHWLPELGRSCDPNPCPHRSICCVFGECMIVFSPEECYAHPGGSYYPMWETCDPNPCPQEAYVCCLAGGACAVLTQSACLQAGGEWRPDLGQSCTPNPCNGGYGVCCRYGDCFITLQAVCDAMGGFWHPEWYTCDPNPCDIYVPTQKTSWGKIKQMFR
jgi:hypothetical protein